MCNYVPSMTENFGTPGKVADRKGAKDLVASIEREKFLGLIKEGKLKI